jgi:UDP-glucose 4-epimerase
VRRRILVTGGSGFVGRTLVRKIARAHDVCVFDSLRFGEGRFSLADRETFLLEEGDVRDKARVQAVVEGFRPEVIIHLAAIHFIPECEARPADALAINEGGTVNLLTACPSGCRFVFASSGAVYRPSTELHDEEASGLGPSDIYGLTKIHGENYLRYLARQRNFPAVAVRLFNVVGQGETNPHLLPELVAQLKAGQRSIRLGNRWPKRDYIHVDDAASAFVTAALDGAVTNGETITVNAGTSVQTSVDEILVMIRSRTGIDFAVETDPARARAVDRPYLGASIKRMRDLFGWQPRHTIEEAIVDLWADPEIGSSS